MHETLNRLFRLAAGYSLVTLAGPLFTIILTPLYTRALSPADYGVVDVAATLSAFVILAALVGMDQALSAHFFDGDTPVQRNLVRTAVIFAGGAGLCVGTGLTLAAEPLAYWLFKDIGRKYILYLLAINAVSAPIYAVIAAALRLWMRVRQINVLGLAFLLATVLSNVVLVLGFHLKATGVVAANVIANVFACGVALWLARDVWRGQFAFPLLKQLALTGLSLLPGAIGYLAFANMDRLILTQFVPFSDLGLYSIANKLASMLYVLLSAVWNAWWPMALEMANQSGAPRLYARMFEYFLVACTGLALGVGIFAPEILMVFTRDLYVPAAPYALTLMVYSGPIGFAAGFFQIGLFVRKKTQWVSVAYLFAAAANIVLNLVLCPRIGVWGSVWATVIAGGILLTGIFIPSQRALPVPYHLGRVLSLSTVYFGLVTAFLIAPVLPASIVAKVGALAILSAMAVATGIIPPRQIRRALASVQYRLAHQAQIGRMHE